ncbi:hypothetical protein GCM10010505_10450 [Kitasatospora aburaviensis]
MRPPAQPPVRSGVLRVCRGTQALKVKEAALIRGENPARRDPRHRPVKDAPPAPRATRADRRPRRCGSRSPALVRADTVAKLLAGRKRAGAPRRKFVRRAPGGLARVGGAGAAPRRASFSLIL